MDYQLLDRRRTPSRLTPTSFESTSDQPQRSLGASHHYGAVPSPLSRSSSACMLTIAPKQARASVFEYRAVPAGCVDGHGMNMEMSLRVFLRSAPQIKSVHECML